MDLLNSRATGSKGEVALRVPEGWTVEPERAPFAFARAGERASFRFTIAMPAIENRLYDVHAVATSDGRDYTEGFEEIDFRDLEARHLYRPSTIAVRGIDVSVVPGLKVGYVMGVGDSVPQGIAQLGYEITLLDEKALATSDLSRFDAVMTGTRAYAVREDLKTYNQRLLDYARNGGHLIVLYNTQELVPNQFAPFPGELTPRAEEVSEEDSPVTILAPAAPMLTFPNTISAGGLRRLGGTARLEILEPMGRGLHADHLHLRQGAGAAAGRLAVGEGREGPLHVLRLRVPPPAPLRRAGRLPAARQPAGPREERPVDRSKPPCSLRRQPALAREYEIGHDRHREEGEREDDAFPGPGEEDVEPQRQRQ